MALPQLSALPKKYLPIIISVAAALVAVVLINVYIQQQAEEAKKLEALKQKSIITVITARQDIPAGTTVKISMVKEEQVNRAVAQPRVATAVDRVIDRITLAPIAKGEQILLNKLTLGEGATFASKIPKGKRAITISVDNLSSVSGMIRPGDHVDMVGLVPVPGMSAEGKATVQTTTLPLFQDVAVLAVGQEYSTVAGQKTISSNAITVALTPKEANIIAFVQEQQGKIRLILRSPEDTEKQTPAPTSWDMVLRTVMPEAFREKPAEAPKPRKVVEIYHGQTKEVKSLE